MIRKPTKITKVTNAVFRKLLVVFPFLPQEIRFIISFCMFEVKSNEIKLIEPELNYFIFSFPKVANSLMFTSVD